MLIRPYGSELLQAVHAVIDSVIVPHLDAAQRDALETIRDTIAVAQSRFECGDDVDAADLAALERAYRFMRGDVLDALPEEHRHDARLVARAIFLAMRELADGADVERREYQQLAALLGTQTATNVDRDRLRRDLESLNAELVARVRAGETDADSVARRATLAFLETTTRDALAQTNPSYIARRSASRRPNDRIPATSIPAAAPAPSTGCQLGGAFAPLSRPQSWLALYGIVGNFLYAASNAAFCSQTRVLGWLTQQLAANPRVPVAAVEGAHQVHDLSMAIADANTTIYAIALAPFRSSTPGPADGTS